LVKTEVAGTLRQPARLASLSPACQCSVGAFTTSAAGRYVARELMMPLSLDRLLKVATWSCVALLALLSLLPAEDIVRTGLRGQFEHFIAYAGAGTIAALAYSRTAAWRLAAMFAAYAALLEIGQNFAPGRHPALIDAAASALGAAAGILLARAARRWPSRRRGAA
jgi:VanZ family protein